MTENGAIRLRSARKIGNRESLMRGSRIRGPFGLKPIIVFRAFFFDFFSELIFPTYFPTPLGGLPPLLILLNIP